MEDGPAAMEVRLEGRLGQAGPPPPRKQSKRGPSGGAFGTSSSQSRDRINSCCFKLPTWWCFEVTSLGRR